MTAKNKINLKNINKNYNTDYKKQGVLIHALGHKVQPSICKGLELLLVKIMDMKVKRKPIRTSWFVFHFLIYEYLGATGGSTP